MSQEQLILDALCGHEASHPERIYLTQPIGAGQVVDYRWREVMDQARRMAAHLKSRNFESGFRVAILSKNCAHFFIAEIAIWMAGGTTVAIFPTETAATVRFVLEHSGASLLFVGKLDQWPQQAQGVPAGLPCIAFALAPPTEFERWDDIVARTEPLAGRPQRAGSELAMLVYTSGSTGTPKGVMHSFERVTAASEGVANYIRSTMGPGVEIRELSYLPLAHIFERSWIECGSFMLGDAHVYFAETLDSFLQDLNRARPTAFISVPRLWLKFQQGVYAKMPPKKLNFLLGVPLLGRLVGRKVLKGLGLGDCLLAGSGSAPIPAELIAWYHRLGLNLMEGYAMTEDFAYSCTSTAQRRAPGCVGVPLPGVQARISEQGEVLIKSPGQFVGYYKQPELTAQSFTEDGFFRTGDMGEFTSDGLLKLTGRVKELFKTSKGKYVAPAPIENLLNAHPMVEMAMVSGVGQSAAYGIVVLTEELRPQLGDAAVRARAHQELERLLESVNAELADYEKLQMIVVAAQPWTIENRCLTPTMKIRRSQIEANIDATLGAWYAQKASVVWAS